MSGAVWPGAVVPIYVTRRQARMMAEAVWRLQSKADAVAPTTVKDQLMLAELRRRLHLAAETP